MRRLPALAFAVLAAATVFAFFHTQHLKTELPVVWGQPAPVPAAFNPVDGRVCPARNGKPLNYRHTQLTVSLPHGGTVAVLVVNHSGRVIATVSNGRDLQRDQLSTFTWNGREQDGQIAPDGTYFFRVTLIQQGRTINLPTPITVMTRPPHPTVTDVALAASAPATAPGATTTTTASGPAGAATTAGRSSTAGAATTAGTTSTPRMATTGTPGSAAHHNATAGPVIVTPPKNGITIHFPLDDYRRVWVDVYRTDVSGKPQLINRFAANPLVDSAHWNGETAAGSPAPAGTYLIGITAQDQACNQASYPALPATLAAPATPATPHLGVTVRYLAATPPLAPTRAGSRAAVAVSSPTGAYRWQLRLAGARKVLRHGSGSTGDSTLRVRLPRKHAGLYTLTLRAGTHATSVPLIASATGTRAKRARVLVVMPILTWQGENEVDDNGDGLPDTLGAGDQITLERPLAHGLPRTYAQDVALVSFLRAHHLSYQLTTDVALAQHHGPLLRGRSGVVLPGDETWLPARLVGGLERFVARGGRALALGTDALRGRSQIRGYPSDPIASAPLKMTPDLFGARHGPVHATDGELVTELTDQLGLFDAVPALPGFRAYESIEPPAGVAASLAGVAAGAPAVTAFARGKGYVVEIGVGGFARSLGTNVDAQELLGRVWQLLAR